MVLLLIVRIGLSVPAELRIVVFVCSSRQSNTSCSALSSMPSMYSSTFSDELEPLYTLPNHFLNQQLCPDSQWYIGFHQDPPRQPDLDNSCGKLFSPVCSFTRGCGSSGHAALLLFLALARQHCNVVFYSVPIRYPLAR